MTPILAALPVDTLIWIVLLIIGAVGSIASNARKAVRAADKMQARNAASARRPVAPAAPAPPSLVAMTFAPPPVAAPPPMAAPPPVVPRRTVPLSPAATPTPLVATPPAPHGTSRFRGMFQRGNLVRAMVATEVLGPPKSLQEQSIWSPRHSEPSI